MLPDKCKEAVWFVIMSTAANRASEKRHETGNLKVLLCEKEGLTVV
jgi:hypothetical protein